MFYDRYQQLCKACGKSPSRVAIETGISKGTVSTWKNLGRTPQTAQLQKLADYFGISIDQLLDETKSALTAEPWGRREAQIAVGSYTVQYNAGGSAARDCASGVAYVRRRKYRRVYPNPAG